jgi:hypothetical protein
MKDHLKILVRDVPTPAHGRNVAREYLQARILKRATRDWGLHPPGFSRRHGTALSV